MSPAHTPRHLLAWSLPTVAILLSFLWYKRRKNIVRCDTVDIDPATSTRISETSKSSESKSENSLDLVSSSAVPFSEPEQSSSVCSTPITYSRSLSGVGSAPIDIKQTRSAPLVISDRELDLEIEKIKSMKSGASVKKHMVASPGKRKASPKASPNTSPKAPAKVGDAGDGEASRGRSVERDSANHSPTDAMMAASPTLSSISDNHSDSDSGKGGSDVATPPPAQHPTQEPDQEHVDNSPPAESAIETSEIIIYEFVIAQQLVGRLIGRHGAFVHHIREKTNARILIKKHPDSATKLKVCAIEGTSQEVDAALAMIREKFPAKRYPELSMERVSFVPIVPDCMHLRLIEGVNNDTIVSCVVTPIHLFLQQPTHPTFPSLNVLAGCMTGCYSDSSCQAPPPTLPAPVHPGTICAAYSSGLWYRASVLSADDEAATASVQFLDYGGYASVPFASLRQIRADFLLLPFQAAECILADVEPLETDENGEAIWSQEAYDTVVELTRGAVVFTQVVDYVDEEAVTPLVHIYVRAAANQRGVVLLNRELVNRGLARWVDHTR